MDNDTLSLLFDRLLDEDARNINRERKRRALAETCDYIDEYMDRADSTFSNRFELLAYATDQVTVQDGLWLEFGVFKGSTICFIASRTYETVFGFDSFTGNPEDWRSEFRKGCFALNEPPTGLPANVTLIKGLFQETLPGFCQAHPQPVAFIHVDCDLYQSTKTIFDTLGKQLPPGAIIVFDEFFNYPGWKQHEFRAFMEFIALENREYEYLGYVYKHSQVAVRILS